MQVKYRPNYWKFMETSLQNSNLPILQSGLMIGIGAGLALESLTLIPRAKRSLALYASDIHPDSAVSDDKYGQNAANALENAIFTAAAGDLPAYQQIFRRIYLDLKTQLIGRGGFTARFSLRRRSKISRVRAAVAQLFDDPTARFFWPSMNHFQEEPGLENVIRPGYVLLVVHGEPRDGLLRRTYRRGPRNCHDDGATAGWEWSMARWKAR
ncbi:hypothetical protein B0H14DRAFT_2580681 [Mycena olivaceomarginata]|nr:hypothetical protein B0H14DRAFT_2580681 [Mycena olivaceomarginata]